MAIGLLLETFKTSRQHRESLHVYSLQMSLLLSCGPAPPFLDKDTRFLETDGTTHIQSFPILLVVKNVINPCPVSNFSSGYQRLTVSVTRKLRGWTLNEVIIINSKKAHYVKEHTD